jgi:superfamily I DNA/RNA helicase
MLQSARMPITPEQKETAIQLQQTAAHDENGQIRIIAGPGTGKSYTIEERVHWLLSSGTDPHSIYAISFTRASAADLRQRIRTYCSEHGVQGGEEVHVSTLHSLALKLLRLAGLLQT